MVSNSNAGRRAVAALGTVLAVAACGGSSTAPSNPPGAPTDQFQSAHFTFHHTVADLAEISATAARLESEYERILHDLGVPTMPRVNVSFYGTHGALVAGAGPSAGPIPAWATGLVTAEDQIHLLSPAVAGPYERAMTNLVHEFAHCVSLRANRTIANNPRWLWEAIAVYEARQQVDPRSLAYLISGQPPPFAQLNRFDNMLVYDVGFLISEFVVSRWGMDRYRSLLAANGDTQRVLEMPLADFERDWYAWVLATYGL